MFSFSGYNCRFGRGGTLSPRFFMYSGNSMTYSVPKEMLAAGPPVFSHAVNGEIVYVKQRRKRGKNPLGHLAQLFLYSLTRNILVMPTEWQAGNSATFETETIRRLAALGVRVPEILHEDDDYFVMSNVGLSLEQYLKKHPDERELLIDKAAAELRRFHDVGCAHGGAQIKNLTVRDGEIHFIDFETSVPAERLAEFQLRDLFLFLLSLERHGHNPDLRRICRIYDGRPDGPTPALLKKCLLGMRPVRILDNRLLKGLSMRDIRSLGRLVKKAETLGRRISLRTSESHKK